MELIEMPRFIGFPISPFIDEDFKIALRCMASA